MTGSDQWARIEARRRERAYLDRWLSIGAWVEFGVFCLAVVASLAPGPGQLPFFVLAMVCAISALLNHGIRRWVGAFSDGAWDAFYPTAARLLALRRFR
ncbi:hypothetical protein [Micromonospora sp. RP3T]|uniref:hypothetical protein n=1 Tax=Micromonospora sp. RP3T TaxID=2135446 RepID=UPI003D75DBDB